MNTVTSKDGTRIAFEQSGKGPAVILVVGAFNERATGAPLAQSLEPHFTVFNYDRRGRGDSSDTAPYAIEREIEDLQALIAKAGGSAWVFGYSSGAILALRECFEIQSVVRNRVYTKRNRPTAIDFEPTKVGFAVSCSDFNRPKAISKHSLRAAAHGLAISQLALYEPPPTGAKAGTLVPRLTELISAGRRGDAVELFQIEGVGIPAAVVAQMRNAPFRPALDKMAYTLVYESTILGALPTGLVTSIRVPTLVIDGAASPEVMRHAAQSLAEALPNGRYRTLDGQGHDIVPAVVTPVLEEFFLAQSSRNKAG